MKLLIKLFNESKEAEPIMGSYIHLCRVLGESGLDRAELTKCFNLLMPKDEYDKAEKKELIDYLYKIANNIPR